MANRKKKPSKHQLEKIGRAQTKNDFLLRVKNFVNTSSGENIYSLFPQKTLDLIYFARFHSFKIIVDKEVRVRDKLLHKIRAMVLEQLKKSMFTLLPGEPVISLNDFYTVGLSAISVIRYIKDTDFPNAARIRMAMKAYLNNETLEHPAQDKLYGLLQLLCLSFYDLEKKLVWFEYKPVAEDVEKGGWQNTITFHYNFPEKISLQIDGAKRPLKRLGWTNPIDGIIWANIKPSQFGVQSELPEIPLDVYMQSHAILRFNERMEGVQKCLVHYFVMDSFNNPKVVLDKHNKPLIEYRYYGKTAGYFKVEIIEGKLIVRTFLFITNGGTPEGSKLEKSTGLQKLDKQYLAIDKLSTFLKLDLSNNKDLQKIFQDAGCQCLIDLYEALQDENTQQPDQQTTQLFLNYLKNNEALLQEAEDNFDFEEGSDTINPLAVLETENSMKTIL